MLSTHPFTSLSNEQLPILAAPHNRTNPGIPDAEYLLQTGKPVEEAAVPEPEPGTQDNGETAAGAPGNGNTGEEAQAGQSAGATPGAPFTSQAVLSSAPRISTPDQTVPVPPRQSGPTSLLETQNAVLAPAVQPEAGVQTLPLTPSQIAEAKAKYPGLFRYPDTRGAERMSIGGGSWNEATPRTGAFPALREPVQPMNRVSTVRSMVATQFNATLTQEQRTAAIDSILASVPENQRDPVVKAFGQITATAQTRGILMAFAPYTAAVSEDQYSRQIRQIEANLASQPQQNAPAQPAVNGTPAAATNAPGVSAPQPAAAETPQSSPGEKTAPGTPKPETDEQRSERHLLIGLSDEEIPRSQKEEKGFWTQTGELISSIWKEEKPPEADVAKQAWESSLVFRAQKAALENKTAEEALAQWEASAKGQPGWQESRHAYYQMVAHAIHKQMTAAMDKVRPTADKAYEEIARGRGLKEGEGDVAPLELFRGLSAEEKQLAFKLMKDRAEKEGNGLDKSRWQAFGEAIGRGFENLLVGGSVSERRTHLQSSRFKEGDEVTEKTAMKEVDAEYAVVLGNRLSEENGGGGAYIAREVVRRLRGRKLSAEEAEAWNREVQEALEDLDTGEQLRQFGQQVIDPHNKAGGWFFQKVVLPVADSAAVMATTIIPVMAAATFEMGMRSYQNDEYMRLRALGMSPEEANRLAALTGFGKAALERLPIGGVLAKFGGKVMPKTSRMLEQFALSGSIGTRLGKNFAFSLAGETLEEIAQDQLIPALVQDILTSDPRFDVKWGAVWSEALKALPDTMLGMVLMSGGGSVMETYGEVKFVTEFSASKAAMRLRGYTMEQIAEIQAAPVEKRGELLARHLPGKAPEGEDRIRLIEEVKTLAGEEQRAASEMQMDETASADEEADYDTRMEPAEEGGQAAQAGGEMVSVDNEEGAGRIQEELIKEDTAKEAEAMAAAVENWDVQDGEGSTQETAGASDAAREEARPVPDIKEAPVSRGITSAEEMATLREASRLEAAASGHSAIDLLVNGASAAEFGARVGNAVRQVARRLEGKQPASSALAVVGEQVSSVFNTAMEQGAITRQEAQQAVQSIAGQFDPAQARDAREQAFRERVQRVASGQAGVVEVSETVAELAMGEVTGRRMDGQSMEAGSVTAALDEAIFRGADASTAEAQGKLRAFLRAVRQQSRGVFGAVETLKNARREGGGQDLDALVDQLSIPARQEGQMVQERRGANTIAGREAAGTQGSSNNGLRNLKSGRTNQGRFSGLQPKGNQNHREAVPAGRSDSDVKQQPRYSLAPEPITPSLLTRQQVERAIKSVAGSLGAIGRNVTVVQSEAHLPSHFREQIAARNATGRVNGFFDPVSGKIYLVADAHRNGAEAVRTLLHEAVGEYGIDRVLPPRDWAQIRRSLLGHPLAREVSQTYAGTRDIGSLTPEQQDQVARETLSKMAEDPSSGGGKFSRVIPLLKAALRRMGIKYAYSHADLMHIVERARETVARESTVQVEGKGDVRFSLQDQVEGNAEPASANSNTAQQTKLEGGTRESTKASPVQAGKVEIVNEPSSREFASNQSQGNSEGEQSSQEHEALAAYKMGTWERDPSTNELVYKWDRPLKTAWDIAWALNAEIRPLLPRLTELDAILPLPGTYELGSEEAKKWRPLQNEWSKRKMELDQKIRAILWIPRAQQEKVKVKILNPSNTPPRFLNQGCIIVQSYTDAALIPEVTIREVDSLGEERESHSNGVITCEAETSASMFAHEITHATEQQTKSVLEAAKNFLKSRREIIYKGQVFLEEKRKLKDITGYSGYKDNEYAFEDHWVERGGTVYSGKLYEDGHATEILTTGIERLHEDSLLFLSTDPEFFLFVVHTLRNW